MSKKLLGLFLGTVLSLIFLAGCAEEALPQHVVMHWGIHEEVEGFEGLEREPEGVEVEKIDKDTLQVTWQAGESYILPISATAENALEGVRYRGRNIPAHLKVEWLDPWEREWHPIEAVPEDRVKAIVEEENSLLSVDFGPPGGADFEEGMTRVIWFRITPTEPADFTFEIFGYQAEEEKEPAANRVTNILILKVEIH